MTQQNTKFTPPHPLNTAVLFLVFNRLDTTKQVFEAIKEAKPPRLYIAADGARESKEGELEKTKAVREHIISNIDWDCEIKTLFREQNMGCGPSVHNAISWFFENEEMGIILEDDCLPSQSFFWYCEELLEKYKDDERVAQISGVNHLYDKHKLSYSYLFSRYKSCWGWASWARSWQNMDFAMSWLETPQRDDIVRNMGVGKESIRHWNNAIESIQQNKVSAWDWQWYFSISSMNQLTIFPCTNLIANIGFGGDATHTTGTGKEIEKEAFEIGFPLIHPRYVVADQQYDQEFENFNIRLTVIQKIKRKIPVQIKKPIKKLLGKG